eukprot:scaffold121057_cov63-Phaeocystis_antarctica.AAC.1
MDIDVHAHVHVAHVHVHVHVAAAHPRPPRPAPNSLRLAGRGAPTPPDAREWRERKMPPITWAVWRSATTA